ncbi:hypothetical protein Btru_029334 [Bulinus truncatus]|nr:hypothetical protein Btru_029334 [Bulinus truncatus]
MTLNFSWSTLPNLPEPSPVKPEAEDTKDDETVWPQLNTTHRRLWSVDSWTKEAVGAHICQEEIAKDANALFGVPP